MSVARLKSTKDDNSSKTKKSTKLVSRWATVLGIRILFEKKISEQDYENEGGRGEEGHS